MKTSHTVVTSDARELHTVVEDSVELVVTSPPYPMIEMWDDLFTTLNPETGTHLENESGDKAFESMHAELDTVWNELSRVLVDGGIACINIGDATRKLGDEFRVYQNHARIITGMVNAGFSPLPEILWRKPTNSGAKFMGSGMLPPNAYVTLEHEYILVFRNGVESRHFEPKSEDRYAASYFWEERNTWFSDVWTDVNGELQSLDAETGARDRSAAYPFEIPYRLINMYSVYGDTVLDPFWGTGTTSLAAIVAGRSSIGYELDDELVTAFKSQLDGVQDFSQQVSTQRIQDHVAFVNERRADGGSFEYTADAYNVPVITSQEQQFQLYHPTTVTEPEPGSGRGDEREFTVTHEPFTTEHTDSLEKEPGENTDTTLTDF